MKKKQMSPEFIDGCDQIAGSSGSLKEAFGFGIAGVIIMTLLVLSGRIF